MHIRSITIENAGQANNHINIEKYNYASITLSYLPYDTSSKCNPWVPIQEQHSLSQNNYDQYERSIINELASIVPMFTSRLPP